MAPIKNELSASEKYRVAVSWAHNVHEGLKEALGR